MGLGEAMDLKAKLSVILPAMRGLDSVRAAIHAWERQTVREQIEIVVVGPEAGERPGLRILCVGEAMLHEARRQGILAARAEAVVIAEDHCLPERDWAEKVLACLAAGEDAIGPALRGGNPAHGACRASFLLGYGEWTEPVESGRVEVLPGHNVVVRKALLERYGEELGDLLVVCSFLIQRLRQDGVRFYLEAGARMRHYDIASWADTLQVFAYVGLGFGARRTAAWPAGGRWIYWLATPAVAAAHWRRGVKHWWRVKRGAQAGDVLGLAAVALVWGVAEGVGAWLGPERTRPVTWLSEVKPVAWERVDWEETR